MDDIDRLSRTRARASARSRRPSPTCTSRTCTAPAASWRSSASSTAPACSHRDLPTVHAPTLGDALDAVGHRAHRRASGARVLPRRARRRADAGRVQPGPRAGPSSTSTARSGVIRDAEHAFSQGRRPGRALRQPRRRRLHREDRRRRRVDPEVRRARRASSRARTRRCSGILDRQGQGRRRGGHPLRGAARRAGHAGDALPDELPEVEGARQGLRADHRRPLLRRHLGPLDRPRLARGGRGRRDRRWSRTATRSRSTSRNRGDPSRGAEAELAQPAAPSRTRPAGSRRRSASAR